MNYLANKNNNNNNYTSWPLSRTCEPSPLPPVRASSPGSAWPESSAPSPSEACSCAHTMQPHRHLHHRQPSYKLHHRRQPNITVRDSTVILTLSPASSSTLLMVTYTIASSTVTCTIVKSFVSCAIFTHFYCHILTPTPAILLSSAPLSSELSPVNTFVSYTIVTSTIDNPTVTYTAVVNSSVT